jgi:hypothetical protein
MNHDRRGEAQMDGYGVSFATNRGQSRYRTGDSSEWDLAEAEGIANDLLLERQPIYVSFGNGEHEFRAWGGDSDGFGDFRDNGAGPRRSDWYVDVEIAGRRWHYRPLADLRDYSEADELAEEAAALAPDVTTIWVGKSDGSVEDVTEVREH